MVFVYGFSGPVYADEDRLVYIGGFPVGIEVYPKGVIVVGAASVETELGRVVAETPLKAGDILEYVDGKEITDTQSLQDALRESSSMTAQVKIKRGTASLTFQIPLIVEDMTEEKKLGIQIRECVAGIGTVTFVRPNGNFVCLGHPITLENHSIAPCARGQAYACKIIGCEKGHRGRAGALKGMFVGEMPNGKLYKNCKSGIYGTFDTPPSGEPIEVAPRKNVQIGKAVVRATVSDVTQDYTIEIIRTYPQNAVSDKGMIVRITDKRLLSQTGGIVQGMSGSPILQNGKLVGAITYVFVSDPTKGYGIYADWMLDE